MENIAIMLLFVDNFDEVMDTVEEIRRPVMVALIDRKINIMARDMDAVLRKFEKDKFLMVLAKDKLDALKDKDFEILTQIREIEMGNSMPVTLSLGIGIGGETLARTMAYAQAAIDLALGRGGDQALIKDGDKFIFFGGGSPETPSNERVTARIKLYALDELMEVAANIIVMGHHHMDEDCLGAAVGISKLAAQKGRECFIVVGTGVQSIKRICEAFIRDAEYENVFIGGEKALDLCGEDTLVIIVDANRPSMVESKELLNAAGKLVVIDHHRLSSDFISNAALTYQEPSASSTCELVCEMMKHVKEPVRLKQPEADLMLAGITVDTKNFTQKTGAKTFEAAAFLRRNGADGIRVKTYLQEMLCDVIAMARSVANVDIQNGRFAVSECHAAENPIQTAARAADELLSIAGAQASFVLAPLNSGTYISARSLGKINVQLIMEKLGGGGHQTMAAAKVETDLQTSRVKLINELNEL
ncbi:MAG: DHH family phosphoesterase [Defluviitaleaceae bacterium]|nr:DHH family phosphoesterase [Defluviitaleaceae bacterium]